MRPSFEYTDEEETYNGLESWLVERRDAYRVVGNANDPAWAAINDLLDEMRGCGVEGYLPWQAGS